ncbi:DUF2125 domain-containing protein [Siccirubricoccus sp. KC 17139]|uniref:DUF2125 domain-containing protein n=1 Tax=Siccirubricoccus soli TaxID=2899147 RepID=A0ABT1DFA3_9PROT|nr:DUF2125 domain-containing protein [Siccirubricoccus soli]MCO6419890.1 DUF2125 domain-containing protein [Siccirubricoccus soli]MCP2686025.1 DUF2125 domain-containing protein [Siccirubricoccus soli]
MSAKPPRRRLPRLLLGAVLLLVLLGAAHGAAWLWLTERLEVGFGQWVALQRSLGRQVSHAPPLRGGWPWAATLTVPDFRWSQPAWGLAAEAVTLRLTPPELGMLEVHLPGRHRLRLDREELPLSAAALTARMPIQTGLWPSLLLLEGEELALGALGLDSLRMRLETALAAGAAEPAATLNLVLDRLHPPPGALGPAGAALGPVVEALSLSGTLSGPLPAGPVRAGDAARWRDAGGALTLSALALRWGPLGAEGSGRVRLDAGLQPRGAATLRVTGAEAALDAAQAAGALPPGNVFAARLMLRVMSRPPEGGGPPEIELPLTLEERRLMLARLPLATLPRLNWPR